MNEISLSALGVAYLRQMEEATSRDTLAKYFTNDKGRRVAEGWLNDYPQVARQIALRGRYIEDTVARYIDEKGIVQAVNVAAGLNTFPYRHSHAPKLRCYAEMDQPQMLDYKKRVVSALVTRRIIEKPDLKILYIPVNLSDGRIGDPLDEAGWDWGRPTVFIVEGISYYLPIAILTKMFGDIKDKSRAGSAIIMDYFPARVQTTKVFKKVMGDIARDGEPCCTCPTPEEIRSLFRDFEIISDRDLPDIEGDYCADAYTIDFDAIVVAERNINLHLEV